MRIGKVVNVASGGSYMHIYEDLTPQGAQICIFARIRRLRRLRYTYLRGFGALRGDWRLGGGHLSSFGSSSTQKVLLYLSEKRIFDPQEAQICIFARVWRSQRGLAVGGGSLGLIWLQLDPKSAILPKREANF